MKAQEKLRIAMTVVDACHVYDVLVRYLTFKGVTDWDEYLIEEDGTIYYEPDGRYLTDAELDEFVEWAESVAD